MDKSKGQDMTHEITLENMQNEDSLDKFSKAYLDKYQIKNGYDPRLLSKVNIRRLLDRHGGDTGIVVTHIGDDLYVRFTSFINKFEDNLKTMCPSEIEGNYYIFKDADAILETISAKNRPKPMDTVNTIEQAICARVMLILCLEHEGTRHEAQGEFKNIARDDILNYSISIEESEEAPSGLGL